MDTYAHGSPRAHQSRHPPPARAAHGARPPPHRTDEALLLPCPARRSSITATRSAWATTSISATGTACARRCNGRRIRNGGFSRADPEQLVLPPVMDPLYGYDAVNVESQAAIRIRSSTGCGRCSPCAAKHRVRARHDPLPASEESQDPRLSARVWASRNLVRRESVARAAGRGARPVGIRRPRAGGDDRGLAISADRAAHLSADLPALRLPVVPAVPGQQRPAWSQAPSEQLPEFVTMVIRAGQTGPTPENVRTARIAKYCRPI